MHLGEIGRYLPRRILVGNLLSASKGVGYVAKEHIRLEVGRMQDEICLLKGMKVTGMMGEFTTNFSIPDLIGAATGQHYSNRQQVHD